MAFLLVTALLAPLAGCRGESSAAGPDQVVAGELRGRTGAFLTLSDAASRVRVVLAALPGQLYRISTPAGSGLAPSVIDAGGRIRAGLRPTGGDGPDEVRIELNRDVRWDIRLPAGAGEQHLDLVGGRVSRLELGGSGLVELRLPRPAGTVPVLLHDAVGAVTVSVGAGTPVRFRLAAGVGSAAGLAGGVNPPGWRTARDRYAILARSAVGSLILHRLRPKGA